MAKPNSSASANSGTAGAARSRSKPSGKNGSNNNNKDDGKKAAGKSDGGGSDPRFARFRTDPLYRLPSKRATRVAVDSRFSRMFHDDAFQSRARVDRYGRKLPKQKSAKDLARLYRLDDDFQNADRTSDGRGREPKAKKRDALGEKSAKAKGSKVEDSGDEEVEDEEDEDDGGVSVASDSEVERELSRLNKAKPAGYDPARDGGFSESSSSEEDTSEEESDEESELDGEDEGESDLASRQEEDVPAGEVSRRIAVVNIDWDNIRAVDLMAVLQSFTRSGGRIRKVTVYPSEFGRERLEREQVEGPPKELFRTSTRQSGRAEKELDQESEEDSEEEDERIRKSIVQEDKGEDFDPAQLRRYQLERLRYFYAVVECSTVACAQEIYENVDGMEYLSTANFFDLRYIPDETDFSNDEFRDSCTSVPDGYKPNDFSTDALRHSKVKLTWDADDVNRKEAQKRAFSRAELDENDLKAYLASDSSDDEGIALAQPEIVDATEATTQEASATGEDGTADASGGEKLSKKEAARQRMRALLGLPVEPASGKPKRDGPVGDMQITFASGLSGSAKTGGSVFENEPIDPAETTVERYKRKERERKARRKENARARRAAESGEVEANDSEDAAASRGDQRAKAVEEDLGFDDPFFTEPAHDQKAAKAAKKEEKRKKRAEREKTEAKLAAERKALEQLLEDSDDEKNDVGSKKTSATAASDNDNDDNDGPGRSKVRHFDMSELKKAEKTLRKTGGGKGKGRARLKPGERAAIEAKQADDFSMDTADPRFASRLYDQPGYAIDPSHPGYSGTEGMQALLEERRRKRAREAEMEDGGGGGSGSDGNLALGGMDEGKQTSGKKRRKMDAEEEGGGGGGGDELRSLVQKMKGRGKR